MVFNILRALQNFLYVKVHRPLVLHLMSDKEVNKKPLIFFRLYFKFFPTPSTHLRKMKVLLEFGGNDNWIETGTYLGDTAAHLATRVSKIYTIEPSEELFEIATNKLLMYDNVKVFNGTSEHLLPEILREIANHSPKNVNFWLDGHNSAGNTFLGENETPILHELVHISNFLKTFKGKVSIFIDDVRCFKPTTSEYAAYPTLQVLIDWASEQSMTYLLKRDVLIIRRK